MTLHIKSNDFVTKEKVTKYLKPADIVTNEMIHKATNAITQLLTQ